MSQTIYGVPGSFCWAELYTNDENKSKDFYNKLFSWKFSETHMGEGSACGHYTHAMIDEGAVGGMMQINDEFRACGVVPHWASYIAVSDCAATVDAAKKLGAVVISDVKEIEGAGTMAILRDPTGAYIHLWQAQNCKAAPARNANGMVGWNELLTTNSDVAKSFYTKVFGWSVHEENINGHTYVSFLKDGKYVAGMMQIQPELGPVPPHWHLYFTTNDIEASRKIAKAEGATELCEPMTLPGIGTMIALKGSDGAAFSLFQWAEVR